jgi:hypothetical protein
MPVAVAVAVAVAVNVHDTLCFVSAAVRCRE